jgi:hypothetical protein
MAASRMAIWQALPGRGLAPLASALDPGRLLAAWPFGPGRFFFVGPAGGWRFLLHAGDGRCWEERGGRCAPVEPGRIAAEMEGTG